MSGVSTQQEQRIDRVFLTLSSVHFHSILSAAEARFDEQRNTAEKKTTHIAVDNVGHNELRCSMPCECYESRYVHCINRIARTRGNR